MKNKFLNALTITLIMLQAVAPIGALAAVSTNQYIYYAGDIVYISGNEMQADEMVNVDVLYPDGSLAQHHEVAADSSGNFSDTYAVPSGGPTGDYTVVSTGQTSGNTFSTTFDPPAPTATLSPTSGPVGTSVTLDAQHFIGNVSLTVKFDGTDLGISCSTNNGGNTPNPPGCPFVVPNASNGSHTVSVTDGTNTASATFTVTGKLNQTITVTNAAPASAAYGSGFNVAATGGGSGNPVVITTSGVCSGGGNGSASITMTSGTGTCIVHYNQAGNSSYNAAPEVTSNTTAQKANASPNVTPYNVTYDGVAHTATGTATGVNGEDLSGLFDLNGTTHTDAGTYNGDPWSFAGDSNYESASGTVNDSIGQAPVTATAGSGASVYDAATHSPSDCAVTGTYKGDLSCANGPASVGPDAGTYPISPVVSGTGLDNFIITKVDGLYKIDKADAVCSISPDYTVTYDGQAHGATGTCAGVGGVDLSAQLNLGLSFTDYPGGTAHWTFSGGTNYNDQSGDVHITINKAPVTATAGGGSGTYNGLAQTPSACVVSGAYKGDLSCANDPASVGPDAGTYAISPVVSGTGLDNFEITKVDGSYEIKKAPVTITAGSGSSTYDGATHSPSACVLSGDYLGDLTCANNPSSVGPDAGSYPISPVPNSANLNNFDITPVNGTYTINKADATINVSGYTGYYDGASHCATGTATGVLNEDLSAGLSFDSCFTNVPGGTAHWTFSGGKNYNDASGDVVINILAWKLTGFYAPVDMNAGVWNTVKGGSTVPLKFNVYAGAAGQNEQTDIGVVVSTKTTLVACNSFAGIDDPVDYTATGGTSLRYDWTSHQFVQNWQTPKKAGSCYQVTMTTIDGSPLSAFFKLK